MDLKKYIDEIYGKWLDIVEKENKIKSIEETAKEIGINLDKNDIIFDSATASAYALVDIEDILDNETYKKLKDIMSWIIGEHYRVLSIKLLLTTKKIDNLQNSSSVKERSEEIGLNYEGFREFAERDYDDYFLIFNKNGIAVYLVVENRENSQ